MATESMAAMAPVRNSRRTSVVVSSAAGEVARVTARMALRTKATQTADLPTLAVEGDAHDRHEEQDPEPAPHAARGHHEEAHRGHVEGRSDDEGLRAACRGGPAA